MTTNFHRRDFLKLLSTLPPVLFLPASRNQPKSNRNPNQPNFIVLVFDAWSAENMSLYGYPRKTTPKLESLADRAIVYHNHYTGGHFTIPGTASLLTGVLPWRHQLHRSIFDLKEFYREKNIFGIFPEYRRYAYSHNLLAEDVIRYMLPALDELKPWQDLYYWANPVQSIFYNDNDISSVSWIRSMDTTENGFANSVFLSRVWSFFTRRSSERLTDQYPLGLPSFSNSYPFLLEDAIDWLANFASTESNPFLLYYHLFPPHDPYHTRASFYQKFASDEFIPTKKPEHILTDGIKENQNRRLRLAYDEYVLYVDAEIDRLFSLLDTTASLENTWIILTSDHGEIFERGLVSHKKPTFFEPLAHIPLIIFPPNRKSRLDIHAPTSAIDILPTLLSITGQTSPGWAEGEVLPPFNDQYSDERPVFLMDGKFTEVSEPYSTASMMLRKGDYKLIHHFGSKNYYSALNGETIFELYDLKNDPEELENIFDTRPNLAQSLTKILQDKMRAEGTL